MLPTVARVLVYCAPIWVAHAADATDTRRLTVADAIETTRAMSDVDGRTVFASPNGDRYAMMLVRGDVRANGVWADIMSGRLSPGAGRPPELVARFFTSGLGPGAGFALYGATTLTMPSANAPVWLDNSHIAFLWEDPTGVIQLVSLDVVTGSRTFVTQSAANILGFVAARDGTLVYDALILPSKEKSTQLLHSGFSVANADALPMLAGYVDGTSMFDFMNCDRYVLPPGESHAKRIDLASPFHCGSGSFLGFRPASASPLFSPDGRRFIINAPVTKVPDTWARYTDPGLRAWLKEHELNPKALAARLVQQLIVVDVRSGVSRALWDAPHNTSEQLRLAWSPDSRSVVLWPTFAPASQADAVELEGVAAFEVNVETGEGLPIPIPGGFQRTIGQVDFTTIRTVQMTTSGGTRLVYRKSSGGWRLNRRVAPEPSTRSLLAERGTGEGLQMELRQDMTNPPVLYSVDRRSGAEEKILDLNPQLHDVALGRVEFVRWRDDDQREWKGRLYYPANYRAGQRYPVVIQARCMATQDEFSLYGCGGQYPTLGPGWSVFLAQVLAGHDIAVLQLAAPEGGMSRASVRVPLPASDEALIQYVSESGWRAAAEHLIEIGVADENAVGIMGYSLTGWVAEYVLTRSAFRYAAAIASDHGNMGYLQATINGWPVGPSNAAGGEPFGAGLKAWIENAPAFNVEKVHTPLQLQLTSSGEGFGNFLWQWEMFSRLRHLGKPVEYYVAPDVQHGSHTLQNPRQLLALQTRALDWWCFWLKGEELSGAHKEEQYRQWRELRRLHELDLGKAISAADHRLRNAGH